MKSFTVNAKGSLGVARVVSDLLYQGYSVFTPFDGSSPVDLVVANNEMSMRRLQVKYRSIDKGMIRVPLSSVVNGRRVPIDVKKIDGWAVFCPDVDRIYYVTTRSIEASKTCLNIRVTDNLHLASVFWEG